MYTVYTTKTFDREISKLPVDYQEQIQNIFVQLKNNPYVGDQLQYQHLREKRLREKRIYYLVYDKLNLVLVVDISGKKDQQATISHIIRYFDEYRQYAEELFRNG